MDDDIIFKPTPSKSIKQPAKKERSLDDWYRAKLDEKDGSSRNEAKPNESFKACLKTWNSRREQSKTKSDRPIL